MTPCFGDVLAADAVGQILVSVSPVIRSAGAVMVSCGRNFPRDSASHVIVEAGRKERVPTVHLQERRLSGEQRNNLSETASVCIPCSVVRRRKRRSIH